MKVSEIKEELVNTYNIDEKEIVGKKKGELADLLEECKTGSLLNSAVAGLKDASFEDVVSEIEESAEEQQIEELNHKEIYKQEDIMALFADDELVDGKFPKVNGLRRVAALVVGDIIKQTVKVNYIPCTAINDVGGMSAIVNIEFECENPHFGKGYISFEAAADCIPDYNNFDAKFKVFPTAIAETRAEARAYRKLLRLDTVSAEELSDIDDDIKAIKGDGKISDLKVAAIKRQCEIRSVEEAEVIKKIGKSKVEEFDEGDFQIAMQYLNKKGI